MDMLPKDLTFAGALIFVLPAISLAGTAMAFIWNKVIEARRHRFETFHALLGNVIRGRGDKPFVDEQAAALYELRRYTNYYPVLKRILPGLKEHWKSIGITNATLLHELDLTMAEISKWCAKREKSAR